MTKPNRLLQIDIIKGIAILFVLIAHSLPSKILGKILYLFYLEQAVPVFVILMGVNFYLSSSKLKTADLKLLYSKEYFKKRGIRILISFFIIFIVALVVGLIMHQTQFSYLTLLGQLPFHGPGNYYLSFVMQFIVLAPLVYFFFDKKPWLTLVACFLISLIFEVSAPKIGFLSGGSYIYSSSFFRYLPGVATGFWLARTNFKLEKLYIGLLPMPLILTYIFLTDTSSFHIPFILPDWGSQNLFTVLYPAFLVILGMAIFPSSSGNLLWKTISYLGKASYHIFLVQIIYFGLMRQTSLMLWSLPIRLIINIVSCIVMALLIMKLDDKIVTGLKLNRR